jgi:hypothetical protein
MVQLVSQNVVNVASAASISSGAIAVQAGDLITMAWRRGDAGGTENGQTDTDSNPWTQINVIDNPATGAVTGAAYAFASVTDASLVCTLNLTANSPGGLFLNTSVWRATVGYILHLDQFSNGYGTNATPSAGLLTPNGPGFAYSAFGTNASAGVTTPGTGWTALSNNGNQLYDEYRLTVGASPITGNMSFTNSPVWSGIVFDFIEALKMIPENPSCVYVLP